MKKIFKYIFLFSIFLSISLLYKNISKKKKKDIITLNLVSNHEIRTMDPIRCFDKYSSKQTCKVYERLYKIDPLDKNYKIIPCLAEQLPIVSSDNKSFIIKIKKGILFHDNKCFLNDTGRELKAYDVIYSIMRSVDPNLNGGGYQYLKNIIIGLDEWREKQKNTITNYNTKIKGLKCLDKYTIEIQTKKPIFDIQSILALVFFSIVPEEAVKFYKNDFKLNPVGTGPFTTIGYNRVDKKIVYRKNNKYRNIKITKSSSPILLKTHRKLMGKKLPLVDKIIVHIIQNSNQKTQKFIDNEIDILELTSTNEKNTFFNNNFELFEKYKNENYIVGDFKDYSTYFFGFNLCKYPFKNNVLLRRAISLCFDTEIFLNKFYNNQAEIAHSLFQTHLHGNNYEYMNPYYTYDIDRAKQILEEAGNRKPLIVTFDTIDSYDSISKAQFLKKSLEKIGIKIKIIPNKFTELLDKLEKGNFMMYDLNLKLFSPLPINVFRINYSDCSYIKSNFGQYKKFQYDDLFEKALSIQNEKDRNKIYEQMHVIFEDHMPIICINHNKKLLIIKPWVKYLHAPFNYDTSLFYYKDMNMYNKVKG